MKINFIFDIIDTPRGGGNQFLKSLKKYFIKNDQYTDDANLADVYLFNSYQYIEETIRIKHKFPDKLFIHRIDGPMRLYNKPGDKRDQITNYANKYLADATIFQSTWSKRKNLESGLIKNRFEKIIINAPDQEIFNPKGKKPFSSDRKISIVSTSWSANPMKGFDVYQWMDLNLDFSKYEMRFIGNSPLKFANVRIIPPLTSHDLADELKSSDIFITGSKNDPCSNSLIEAMHCRLPVIALNSGGHPEITRNGGELFNTTEEIPDLLERIVNNYKQYQNQIDLPTIETVGKHYADFIMEILTRKSHSKSLPSFVYFRIYPAKFFLEKSKSKLIQLLKKFLKNGRNG